MQAAIGRASGLAGLCVGFLAPMAYAVARALGGTMGWALAGESAMVAAACATLGLAVRQTIGRVLLKRLDQLLIEQRDERLRFDATINNMAQGLCFFDGSRRLIVANEQYARMYRLPPESIRPGTTLTEIVDRRFDAGTCPVMSREEYLAWRETIAITNTASDTVIELTNGRTFSIHHQPMPDGGWVATHEDITERKRAEMQIARMARHDALTELPNRLYFREQLTEALRSTQGGGPVAVLCIDLDRFKAVNDTLGHPVGDQLLRAVAKRLCECVRQTDLVARLGGDEFAIIQTAGGAQPAASHALASRVVRSIAIAFDDIAGHRLVVGASVGITLSSAAGASTDPDELLKQADLALYDAKARGRGTFSAFRTEMDSNAHERRALENDLRLAIDRNELELFYQPIVSLGRRKVVALEALLRWRHPQRGLVPPDAFIPIAEDTGIIDLIGEWVLHRAFAEAMRWPAHLLVAVNLSPVQFIGGALPATVRAALATSGLAPSRVELEITESVLLVANSGNLAVLRELHALGVRVCLDDFGVGYSSLSYLRSFPFQKIKIDRSFIHDMASNQEAQAVIAAVSALGRGLHMTVTAEGVETEAQFNMLSGLGCDEAQGYLLSPPRPAHEIAAMLRKLDQRLIGVAVELDATRWPAVAQHRANCFGAATQPLDRASFSGDDDRPRAAKWRAGMTEIRGGCRCGAVRYALALDALPTTYACHCRDCQTWTGSAFSQQTFQPEETLSVSGPVVIFELTTPSGRISLQRMCSVCHTRIYNSNSARPGVVVVRAGTLDRSDELDITAHIWVKRKQPWLTLPEGVPSWPESAPLAELAQALVAHPAAPAVEVS